MSSKFSWRALKRWCQSQGQPGHLPLRMICIRKVSRLFINVSQSFPDAREQHFIPNWWAATAGASSGEERVERCISGITVFSSTDWNLLRKHSGANHINLSHTITYWQHCWNTEQAQISIRKYEQKAYPHNKCCC